MKLNKIEQIVYTFYEKYNPGELNKLENRFKVSRMQEKNFIRGKI